VLGVVTRREVLVFDWTAEEGGLLDGVQGRDALSRCALAASLPLLRDGEGTGGGVVRGRSAPSATAAAFDSRPAGRTCIAGMSDGSVRVADLASGSVVATFRLPDGAAPRLLRLRGGAQLLLTASYGGASAGASSPLLSWDLRTPCRSPVAAFAGQQQRLAGPLCAGADATPCGRFVLSGSADRSVYVFDVRRPAAPLDRIRGTAEAVADVAAHPCRAVGLAGCADGALAAVV